LQNLLDSTVVKVLEEEGISVIDCDQISRDIFQVGWPAYKRVVKEFGPEVLLEDGRIDRKKLGALVFENPSLRRKLGSITG
jgi:dephospho-CoA kinase